MTPARSPPSPSTSCAPRCATASIDTVVVAFPDMQGRLQGKRIHAQFFLDTVLEHGTEGCNYLLAVDVDMNTVDGYAISSWERGYGDMEFVLDLATLHPVPWIPGTAMVHLRPGLARRRRTPRSSRAPARSCAPRSTARPSRGWSRSPAPSSSSSSSTTPTSRPGTWPTAGLTPANQYNVDYSLLGTSRVEPLLRDIRNGMFAAGLVVESAKGECNLGQHEIAFKYDEVIRTADQHSIYKNGAKEIASQHGKALTFMAKFDQREGNSCHIHMSLRGDDGAHRVRRGRRPDPDVPAASSPASRPPCASSRCSTRRTSTPTSGSSRAASPRRRPRGATTTAPARCGSSGTAPGCGWRTGCPVATSTPTSPWPACWRSGLRGIELGARPRARLRGQRLHVRPPARCRRRCRHARDLFAASAVARELLGDAVVDHYTNYADVELAAFGAAVTDWERFRGFERM